MEYMIIIWFVIIIVAAIIEINTMDLSSIWFSAGALVSFILSLVNFNAIGQIVVFLVVSLLLLISVRPIVKNYLKTNVISTNSDRLIGKVAVCTKEIKVGERGEVKIDGKYWLALSTADEDIEEDEKVEVLAIEGVKLIVNKI
ncbi:MAG: NfeD family protein [Bacilli bacterium]|nr:NfeD family protein [Bacilli bacterium]